MEIRSRRVKPEPRYTKEPTYVRIARANSESMDRIKFILDMSARLELIPDDARSIHMYRIRVEMAASKGTYFTSRIGFKGY